MKRFTACLIAAALLPLVPVLQADDSTADLIEQYDLEVADTPVRERADWQKPQRIVVAFAGEDRLAWLQEAVPDVELVGVNNRKQARREAANADALIGLCSQPLLEAGKKLRWIQLYSAGVEYCVDTPAIEDNPDPPLITNMQRIAAPVIAEHVIGMIFALSRNFETFIRAEDSGAWRRDEEATGDMRVIKGKTMLVVGLGGIGTETARRAHALGMRIIATRNSKPEGPDFVSKVGLPPDLKDFITEADVVVNALPLTDKTRDLFDAAMFDRMKNKALFINVGRGGTVVTEALIDALNSGKLLGAGLDVTDPEPLPPQHPLWEAPNTIITPHVATRSDLEGEARWRVVRENLKRYVAGEPMLSVVKPERGY